MKSDFLELNMRKLPFAYYGNSEVFLKGCLYSASPVEPKPKNISTKKWSEKIINSASQYKNKDFSLVILRSFWLLQWGEIPIGENLQEKILKLNDTFELSDFDWGFTPISTACEIIKTLQSGNDVLVPASSNNVSGFIPSLLNCVLNENSEYPHKLTSMLTQNYDFEVNPLQLAYLFGFYDGERISTELSLAGLKGTRFDQNQ